MPENDGPVHRKLRNRQTLEIIASYRRHAYQITPHDRREVFLSACSTTMAWQQFRRYGLPFPVRWAMMASCTRSRAPSLVSR
jgi:hypothetical protein